MSPDSTPLDDASRVGEVVVVDDDDLLRETVRVALGSVGLQVTCHADAQAFLDAPAPTGPACVVTDMRMPRMSGLALLQNLRATGRALPVIVMTGHADVPLTVETFRSGAFDFLEKPFSMNSLIDMVGRALEQDRVRLAEARRVAETRERFATLTDREQQVAELLGRGQSNKEIARVLEISPRTVERHRERVLDKMEVRNSTELAAMLAIAERREEG